MSKTAPNTALLPIQTSDHDILITLVATVNNNHVTLLDKISDIQTDVTEVKTITNTAVQNLDQRLESIETLRDQIQPLELVKQVRQNSQWIHDFQTRWKLIVSMAAIIGGVIQAVAAQFVINWHFLFR